MNDFQNYGVEKKTTLPQTSKFLQLAFTVVFVLAVAVVPSIATINFFLI